MFVLLGCLRICSYTVPLPEKSTQNLVVVGWILVDQGLRFPGSQYAAVSSSVSAHDPMVAAGNMTCLLGIVVILELIDGAAIYGAAKGSGRAPGELWMLSITAAARGGGGGAGQT